MCVHTYAYMYIKHTTYAKVYMPFAQNSQATLLPDDTFYVASVLAPLTLDNCFHRYFQHITSLYESDVVPCSEKFVLILLKPKTA